MSIAEVNAHTVRQVFSAWNASDFKALAGLLHPEVGWYIAGKGPFAGEISGREAVLARFDQYQTGTQRSFRASLKQVLQSEDGRIVAIHHDTGVRGHKRLNVGCCTVFEMEDGLILEGRDHFFDLDHWDDFWS